MNPSFAATVGTCVPDPTGTEINRSYYHSAGATTTLELLNNGGPGSIWFGQGAARLFGVHVPQTKTKVYIVGRCVGADSFTATLLVKDGTANSTIATSGTLTFGATWTMQSVDADFSGTTAGNVLDYRIQGVVNAAGTNYDIAYIAIQPVNNDEHGWLYTNGLPVSSSVNLKVVDTTGAGIVTGPTSATGNNMAVFDGTTGKIKDGGAPPVALHASVPAWLLSYSDGSEGALTCNSPNTCSIASGTHWYSSVSVQAGAIVAVNGSLPGAPFVIHSTGSCVDRRHNLLLTKRRIICRYSFRSELWRRRWWRWRWDCCWNNRRWFRCRRRPLEEDRQEALAGQPVETALPLLPRFKSWLWIGVVLVMDEINVVVLGRGWRFFWRRWRQGRWRSSNNLPDNQLYRDDRCKWSSWNSCVQ